MDNEAGLGEKIEPELITQFRQTRASGVDQSYIVNVNTKMEAAGTMAKVHKLG